MFELVYRSIAKPDISAVDIENILYASRVFNSAKNITGCLLFYNHEFIQLLEGERQTVEELYETIKKDHRHSSVTLIAHSDKKERAFQHWSMAYQQLGSTDLDRLSSNLVVKNFIALSQFSENPTYAISLFLLKAKEILYKDTPPVTFPERLK